VPEPGLQVPDSAGGVSEPEKGVAVHHGLRLGGAQRLKEQFPARSELIFSKLKGQCHEVDLFLKVYNNKQVLFDVRWLAFKFFVS